MGALDKQLFIQILLKKAEMDKELFLLEMEKQREVYISDDLA